jgi:hypothetical protein
MTPFLSVGLRGKRGEVGERKNSCLDELSEDEMLLVGAIEPESRIFN